jgi:hypothetical protein
MAKNKLKLYWVETADHDEDWFIVARSKRQAERFHEDAEGYDKGDAEAEHIATLPPELQEVDTGWPDDEVVIACGGKIIEHEQNAMQEIVGAGMREVHFGDRVFKEGDIVSNVWSYLLGKTLFAEIKSHIESATHIDVNDGAEKILNGAGLQSLNFFYEFFPRDEDLSWNEIAIYPEIYTQEDGDTEYFIFSKLIVRADRIAALLGPETCVITCDQDVIAFGGNYRGEHVTIRVNFEPKEDQTPKGTACEIQDYQGVILWNPNPPKVNTPSSDLEQPVKENTK